MRLPFFIIGGLLVSSLYSQSQTIDGVWNGGGTEVFAEGNQHYCFRPIKGSSIFLELDADSRRFNSCIYLILGDVKASECGEDPVLEINNLDDKLYKIVLAPQENSDNEAYTLSATSYEGELGRCTDYYQAGYLSMSVEAVNALLAVAGLLTAAALYGSVTYVILTLGNF
ncbi:hypothetical protein KKG72_04735 [bacterium]|nr:hypothetical protein [bacterium]